MLSTPLSLSPLLVSQGFVSRTPGALSGAAGVDPTMARVDQVLTNGSTAPRPSPQAGELPTTCSTSSTAACGGGDAALVESAHALVQRLSAAHAVLQALRTAQERTLAEAYVWPAAPPSPPPNPRDRAIGCP